MTLSSTSQSYKTLIDIAKHSELHLVWYAENNVHFLLPKYEPEISWRKAVGTETGFEAGKPKSSFCYWSNSLSLDSLKGVSCTRWSLQGISKTKISNKANWCRNGKEEKYETLGEELTRFKKQLEIQWKTLRQLWKKDFNSGRLRLK